MHPLQQHLANTQIDPSWAFLDAPPPPALTHRYHRYPAKFTQQLAARLITEYSPPAGHINDPFIGSGTTAVEALLQGRTVSGTDINPLAVLMTQVKMTPLDPLELEQHVSAFMDIWSWKPPLPYVPQLYERALLEWFPEEHVEELGRALSIIRDIPEGSVQRFFQVAFSHILKICSRWSNNSTKPIKDKAKVPTAPQDAMRRHLKQMLNGNAAFYTKVTLEDDIETWFTIPFVKSEPIARYHAHQRLIEMSAVRVGQAKSQPVPACTVDTVVTSSPYVTSYEYADIHQLSTMWLGLADMQTHKGAYIGTTKKRKDYLTETYPARVMRSGLGRETCEAMESVNAPQAASLTAFFLDMEDVFAESYRVLKPGGYACYVIGDTTLKRIAIPTGAIFAETLQCCGFHLAKVIHREIPHKTLPQARDPETGRFVSQGTNHIYPTEFILVAKKSGN